MKHYYGREWYCGKGVTTGNDYHDACSYHIFNSKKERDNWIEAGNDYYPRDNDYREECPASDRYLRRMLNHNDPYSWNDDKGYFVDELSNMMIPI